MTKAILIGLDWGKFYQAHTSPFHWTDARSIDDRYAEITSLPLPFVEAPLMQETPVTPQHPQHHEHRSSFRRVMTTLIIGTLVGLGIGLPAGWFAHRLFFQQRAAQVLLCRQQHYGQPEADLQSTCGSVF